MNIFGGNSCNGEYYNHLQLNNGDVIYPSLAEDRVVFKLVEILLALQELLPRQPGVLIVAEVV